MSRRDAKAHGSDRVASDLAVVAAVSDRGLRHRRNEDAFAIEARDGRVVAVVCDGVSNTATPEWASRVAADTALGVLGRALAGPLPDAAALLHEAAERAQDAVAALADGEEIPATTLVAAIVVPGLIGVVNIGDSRAYWLAEEGRQLSVDDAWDRDNPLAMFRWLGADAPELEPVIAIACPSDPGTVLLCTDGLSSYFPQPQQLRELVCAQPIESARGMVAAALAAGGADNVTAAVVSYGPADRG